MSHSLRNARLLPTKLLRIFVIVGILIGANLVPAVPVAQAATIVTVDLTSDPIPIQSACTNAVNDCSLRGAVIYANAHPHTEIVLTHGAVYTLSIPPAGVDDAMSGDLNITADTTIDFGNQLCMFNCPATVKGITGWSDGIFFVHSGATVSMSGLIITNGNAGYGGGGVRNQGTLTFSASTVSGNTAATYGGGIFNSGTLTMTGTTVTNNISQQDGGGIANYNGTLTISSSSITSNSSIGTAFGGGGLFSTIGAVTISDSTFMSNTTTASGGGINAGGAMTLTNTLVTMNTAVKGGGGIFSGALLSITGGTIMTNTTTNGPGGGLNNNNNAVVISGTNISGNHASQGGGGISSVGLDNSVTLSGAAVNNNQSTTAFGGGIYSGGGTLIVQANSTVNGNTTGGSYGPGIYASGALTMTDSVVSGNTGGGNSIYGGGIYLQTTTATITHSTISNNTLSGGSPRGGGLYLASGVLTMTTSTVDGNTVSGTNARGGGIASVGGTGLTLVASTISNNTASQGGGLYVAGNVTATNSTVSENVTTGGYGGGFYVDSSASSIWLANATITNNHSVADAGGIQTSGTITLTNTLLAGNTAGSDGPDCWGNLVSQGYNLVGNSIACAGLTNGVNGDHVGNSVSPLNPYLGALTNNGGPTKTHALLASSPAIDAGDPVTCLPTDQRGVARPAYAHCDIGAYEYDGPGNPVPHIDSLNPATKEAGSSGFTLTVNGSNFVVNSVVRWNGSNRSTTYINAGQLTAAISAADISSLGVQNVTVFNPTPVGGTSNVAPVNVLSFTPTDFLNLPLLQK